MSLGVALFLLVNLVAALMVAARGPAPVSALLSALVVKASFYLILRLWLGPFAPLAQTAAWLPALLGAAAILWGSWRAIRAERLKLLVACAAWKSSSCSARAAGRER